MSDGKLQVEAKLKVDVSEASVLQNKLRELSSEQDKIAQKTQRNQKVSSPLDIGQRNRMTTVLRGFSQGGVEGGLAAVAKVSPKMQGALVSVLGSLFLVQQAFQVGWKAGGVILDKTIGKLDRMAEASKKATKAIYEGIKNAQKESFEKAEKRIEKRNKSVDEDSGYRLSALSRKDREESAARRLNKAQGGNDALPSSASVDEASERLRAQQDKMATLQKEYDAQKAVADNDKRRALESLRAGSAGGAEMGAIARLQAVRLAVLSETLAAEQKKQADLEAELQSAKKIAGIDLATNQAELDAANKEADKKAQDAKIKYERTQKTPSEVLADTLSEADRLKAQFEAASPGVDRSNLEAQYWAKLNEAVGMQDSLVKKEATALPTSTDAYARIGAFIGGAGGSGIDYTRRTATATEKSVTLLGTIASKLQPAQTPVAAWG